MAEGGYDTDPVTGSFAADNPSIQADLVPGQPPSTVFGYVVEAVRRRRALGLEPFFVMSCDNILSNGHATRSSIMAFAAPSDHRGGRVDWRGGGIPEFDGGPHHGHYDSQGRR